MSIVISQRTPDTHVFLHHDFYLEQKEGNEGHECEEESSDDSSIGLNEESSLSSFSSSSSPSKEEDGSDVGEEQEEVQSRFSLESMDDSLPIKRGLSNYFNGKSKSFQNLSEVAETSDLVKKENPFNKKRRILMSCKSSWRRRASCASLLNTSNISGLLHSLKEKEEEEEEEEEEERDEENAEESSLPPLPPTKQRLTVKKSFRSPRCFSLSDLNYYAN